jgi:glycosyltransferase involved in cell wall biosynthesis
MIVFAIPGDLTTVSGGYGYDRAILREARAAGVDMSHLALPGAWPHPSVEDVETARRLLSGTPERATLLVDALALSAAPPEMVDQLGRRVVALVHHPLGLEAGLPADRARALIENERAVLARVAQVVVTSRDTKARLARDFDVPAERIVVAEPGTAKAARAAGSGGPGIAVCAVGSILPRKGYLVLAQALARIADLDWRLDVAGGESADPAETARVREALARFGLAGRVALRGALPPPRLDALYAASDLFVMPSFYEGYGMALAEAMARGLPIVMTRAGAAADVAPDAAALKVEPGDVEGLAAALARAICDPALRARMSDASWAAGRALPDWPSAAARVVAACEGRAIEAGA